MSKHTKGPWEAKQYIRGCPRVVGPNFEIVALCADREAPNLANARLIAAAPEMLEALIIAQRLLLQGNHSVHHIEDDLAIINAAIAKAEGGD